MNRHDREVRSTEKLIDIMDQCKYCRLAMHDEDGTIYVVPVNFGYEVYENDDITLWFHGTTHGKKLSLLRKNPQVGFEMDCNIQLIESASVCSYSYSYMSLVGKGQITFVDDSDIPLKQKAMSLILKHQANLQNVVIPPRKLQNVTIYYLTVQELSGKMHV